MPDPVHDPRLTPYLPTAIATHDRYFPRGPFISVMFAQAILESAWFTRPSGKNNYFGIKANFEQRAAGTYTARTTHEVINGQTVTISDRFADYPTIADCFDAHAHLLTSSHYDRCVHAPTPDAYAHALQDCGYATAPTYATALIDLMHAQNLYALDALGITTTKIASTIPRPTPGGTDASWLTAVETYLRGIFHGVNLT
jgi:flagellum-specific peptidoglycan hydrolase FlgJ